MELFFFIGGKSLFDSSGPSSANPQDVAREVVEHANYLVHCTKEVSVLRSPKRNENKLRSQTTIDIF